MNKDELIKEIVIRTGNSQKDVAEVINTFTYIVAECVARQEKVKLVGFGTFESKHRAAREGRNPKTGEIVKIAATDVPVFKPGKAFKDACADD